MDDVVWDAPSLGRPRVDRYELLAEIDVGGMATVYLARPADEKETDRWVAIKRLHPHLERQPEFIAMFLDEARIAARLHHPNVVSTYEVGVLDGGGGYYLVMDYVEGDTLAGLLTKTRAKGQLLDSRVALRIVLDALAGLDEAHNLRGDHGESLGLVHRDASPHNILVGTDGIARISDFGVAYAATRLSSTRTGQLKGKLGYMAPEQAKGFAVDRRSDVFAMGVVLWETLAARRLFRGPQQTDAETLHRILYEEVPRLRDARPDVPPALENVCIRALARRPEQRFASCSEFAAALEDFASSFGGIATAADVACTVQSLIGSDIAMRREAIRTASMPLSIGITSAYPSSYDEDDSATMPDLPRSSSTLAGPSRESSVASSLTRPRSAASGAKSESILVGAIAGGMVATVVFLLLLWFLKPLSVPPNALRTPTNFASGLTPPLPTASGASPTDALPAPEQKAAYETPSEKK